MPRKYFGDRERILSAEMGRRIAELRAAQNLSQREFAKLLDVDKNIIYNIENGYTVISFYLLLRIARGLRVSLSQIASDAIKKHGNA